MAASKTLVLVTGGRHPPSPLSLYKATPKQWLMNAQQLAELALS